MTISNGETTWTLDDLCARWEGECLNNQIVKLAPYVEAAMNGNITLTYPLWFSDDFEMFVFPASFGSPVVNDDVVVEVPAIQLLYWASNHSDFDINV